MTQEKMAWQRAEENFRDAYGNYPDFDDVRTDRPLFLQLLEVEVSKDVEAKVAAEISALASSAAERIRAIGTEVSK